MLRIRQKTKKNWDYSTNIEKKCRGYCEKERNIIVGIENYKVENIALKEDMGVKRKNFIGCVGEHKIITKLMYAKVH